MSKRVDAHAHYLPQDLLGALRRRAEIPFVAPDAGREFVHWGGSIVYPVWREAVDLEVRLSGMDALGIDMAVLAVNVPGVDGLPRREAVAIARACNDELVAIQQRYPDRFAALATLPMQDPHAAAEELVRMHEQGLRGAQIYSNVAGAWLDEPQFRIIFDLAGELDVPLLMHPTYPLTADSLTGYALTTTLGFLFDTTTSALRLVLDGLYERHPRFRLMICHAGSLLPYVMGRVDYESERYDGGRGALSVPPSEQLRRLYTDTVCVWPPTLQMALDAFGHDRVLFGTDEPFWQAARSIDTLDALDLDDSTLDRVYWRNAERLFGLRV